VLVLGPAFGRTRGIAFTFRVDTPCTYISANAATSAFSER
jgi:hypothetical protein